MAGADMDNLVNLGLLNEGDVTLTITPSWVDQTCHPTGDYILEKYYKGSTIVVEAELAEVTNYDMWEIACPTGEKQMDASTPPLNRFAGNKASTTEPYIGQKGTSLDQYVCLRPVSLYVDASTETARDLVIPQAINVGGVPMALGIDSAHVLPLEIHGMFNPSATEGEHLWWNGITDGTWVLST